MEYKDRRKAAESKIKRNIFVKMKRMTEFSNKKVTKIFGIL